MTIKEKNENLKNLIRYFESPCRIKQMIFHDDDDPTDKKNIDKYNEHMTFASKNGFAMHECWNLDVTIAMFIYPRLKYFRNHTKGYPEDDKIKSMKDWKAILDEMIFAIGEIASRHIYTAGLKSTKRNEEIIKRVDHGLDLFREYFFALWW